jgi:hypothetical protein
MENKNLTSLEYEVMKQKLKEQFRIGKSLLSKGGAFAPLLEDLISSTSLVNTCMPFILLHTTFKCKENNTFIFDPPIP